MGTNAPAVPVLPLPLIEVVNSKSFFVLAVNEDDYFDSDRHASPVGIIVVVMHRVH